ncbi:MAG: EAL domain-containing protein [Lachnospiraceae bacterium]|nr:EAL domain-containing protein [Lachnospiraceae bacterium]
MAVRKRIAILVGQADENYQHLFIEGFLENIFGKGFDVCIFSMYKKYQNTTERETGESNIYNLVNFSLFDAVIYLKDTIQTPGVANSLEERIHERFKGPVLCIDLESHYYPTLWTDTKTPVKELINHLIKVHGYKDIAFLTGKKWHIHSKQRLAAYEEAMHENGLEVRKDRIFYGDFWYTSGNSCAEELLKKKDDLPDAVACANDCMAIGVCEGLAAGGLRIPEDIAVIGYDSIEDGRLSPKPITSAPIPAKQCGINAAIMIADMIEGKKTALPIPVPELFIGESCGCKCRTIDPKEGRRHKWATEISSESYYSLHNSLLEDMLSQTDFEGFLNIVYSYLYQIQEFDSFHLCLNDQWLSPGTLTDGKLLTKGYPPQMLYAIRGGSDNSPGEKISLTEIFETEKLLPELDKESEKPRVFIFTPVHFEANCFGYAVINYGERTRSYDDTYRLWIHAISCGLEVIRRLENSKNERNNNIVLAENKVHDNSPAKLTDLRSLSTEEREDLELVKKILDENLLKYYFQPIVNAQDGSIFAYEALMRSNTNRMISPLAILKYAGMLGRLTDVEKATFTNVLKYVSDFKSSFEGKHVFINSIPGVHMNPAEAEHINNLLIKNSDTAVVELTEQAELDDNALDEMKKRFREMEIQTAVDDYGTGYSNITNLLRYMPNYVKIDRALLSEIQSSAQKQHFVREIIDFSHDNNILALAEGIETSEELKTVILLGVDLIQGYYTSRPSPEVIQTLPEEIVKEINNYAKERIDGTVNKVYIAGRTNRVSLNNLHKDGYTCIKFEGEATYRDVVLVGSPGLKTGIHVEIGPDYQGTITLENAYLTNIKERPSIIMEPGAQVNLMLKGESTLHNGGIKVPEGAMLIVEGDGHLNIELNCREYFGIGNDRLSSCGDITFTQDGTINISGSGMYGIGIGAGLGGSIAIGRGKYVIKMEGNFGIAYGFESGLGKLDLFACDFEADLSLFSGTGIGSINGSTEVSVTHCTVKVFMGGIDLVGIGTMNGAYAKMHLDNGVVNLDLRGEHLVGIGSVKGETEVYIHQAALRLTGEGKNSLSFGGDNENCKVMLDDADSLINLKSGRPTDSNCPDENYKILGGRCKIMINGVQFERKIDDKNYV